MKTTIFLSNQNFNLKHYYLIFSIFLLLGLQSVQAQITLNLSLNSRPQPRLYEWSNPINGQMIITFIPGAIFGDASVKLRTTLLDEGENILGISNISMARVINLKFGVNLFSMADALQLQNLSLVGKVQNLLQRTGRLASGQYQLMVEVMNPSGDVVLAKQTRPFFVRSYQLPVLMSPSDGAQLEARIAQSMITFRWTRLIPSSEELPNYRVQVFEILPGQELMQAFRSNRPILDAQATRGTTQFIWRPNLSMLDATANSRFIWTVQSLDMNGQPIPTDDTTTQGRSEPAVFYIKHQVNDTTKNLKDGLK